MSITVTRHWKSLEQRSASAFVLAGVLIVASFVIPVGLETLTDLSWASGLVLVGLAVVVASIGLFGLYPQVRESAPRLAVAGAGATAVAGVAAVGLIALVGAALVSMIVPEVTISEPMGIFVLMGVLTAGGFALGLLLFGIASWQAETSSRTVSSLLIAGGGVLLVPVIVELLGLAFEVGTPARILFPVIGMVALDALAIGYGLRR